MSACPRCGTDSGKAARFCRSCGTDLEAAAPTPSGNTTKVLPPLTGVPPAGYPPAAGPMPPPVAPGGPGSKAPNRLPWIIAIVAVALAIPIAAFAIVTALSGGSDSERADLRGDPASDVSTTSSTSTTSTSTTTTTTTLPLPVTPTSEMQSIIDAVLTAQTAHDWNTVRAMYPYLAGSSDDDLDAGYRTTDQQFAILQGDPVPVGQTAWSANYLHLSRERTDPPVTKVFCQHWTVDVTARTVNLQARGGVPWRGDPLPPDLQGWITPSQVPTSYSDRC